MVSIEDIEARLRDHDSLRATQGDHVLNPHNLPDDTSQAFKPAAVLLPIVSYPDGPTVLFTKRTDKLDHHPGQVSFPGGHANIGDKSPIETALRETEEEVGIHHRHIRTIGRIDTYLTSSRFSIIPIVGLLAPPFDIDPDPVEVAEVFEVPLTFLLDGENHWKTLYHKHDKSWETYEMPYNGYRIWGVTAGMFRNFYEIVVGNRAIPARMVNAPPLL